MADIHLHEPFTGGGAKRPYYFNGRLLTAEDLREEQAATAHRDALLGLGVGEGIAYGFHVQATPADSPRPDLKVTAGVAVASSGEPLRLAQDVTLKIFDTEATEERAAERKRGDFEECRPGDTPRDATGAGYYLLVASPKRTLSGSAPMISAATADAAYGCGSRHEVDAVCFRLLRFDPSTRIGLSQETKDELAHPVARGDAKALARRRNLLAHACFGTEAKASLDPLIVNRRFYANPFQELRTSLGYGVLDQIAELHPDDVPLSVLYWAADGFGFADVWAVRRAVAPPQDRRVAEGAAAFRQFQEHLDDLRPTLSAAQFRGLKAAEYFRFLPPVGLVPLGDNGVRRDAFLAGLETQNGGRLDGKHLAALLQSSYAYDAIDLDEPEPVWTYRIHAAQAHRRYLIFTRAHMPISHVTLPPNQVPSQIDVDGLEEQIQALEDRIRKLEAERVDTPAPGPRKAEVTAVTGKAKNSKPRWGEEVRIHGRHFGRGGRVFFISQLALRARELEPRPLELGPWTSTRITAALPTVKEIFGGSTKITKERLDSLNAAKWVLIVKPEGDGFQDSDWTEFTVASVRPRRPRPDVELDARIEERYVHRRDRHRRTYRPR